MLGCAQATIQSLLSSRTASVPIRNAYEIHTDFVYLQTAFLDFSSSNGTDLRKAGVGPGQRFCLEASTWKSAADKGIEEVPKVKLEATHEGALKSLDLNTLKKWAAAQESQDKTVLPGENKESWARESKDIGGKEPRA
jgi:hypothetical protein